ncbi:Ig-like domain-containing protein [Nocardioides sp.]|uniref:L,D-transpeptidase n=1 Tax=Nocardioides sp. TaxID=35761 RepID=UPI0027359AC7|nr:Ig-like domain-containing protein [Nocardioides sp.]MDP3891608.1 Ig-like domain-containing protein [Nocardioides sp.]
MSTPTEPSGHPARRPPRVRPQLSRILVGVAALALVAPGLSSCESVPGIPGGAGTPEGATVDERVRIRTSVGDGAEEVAVSHVVEVEARGGSLLKVRLVSAAGEISGSLSDDGTRWVAGDRLEPGSTYTTRVVAEGSDGQRRRVTRSFRTIDLSLSEQTFASVAPLDGETVGVGMPVVVTFDIPVSDRATFERQLTVTSVPQQAGTWHWVNDSEVHYRPKRYWRAGSDVTVDVDINGVPAGGGVYGQESRSISFTVGDEVIHRVEVGRHRLRTFINGDLARTLPISAGKAGFETRSGTKVIMEKHRRRTMDAATTGISPGHPEYYNIENVEYALRVTHSGEFLHAAPWSAGSQGSANVSHGCVGMSTADARWVYENSRRGDVVEVTGTDRRMDLYNGWGDWNASYAEYRSGSAL